MRLRILPGGEVVLTMPPHIAEGAIETFLIQHAVWIEKWCRRMRHRIALPISGRRAYLKHKEKARAFITDRVRFWNQYYGFSYGRIAIKNTKTCWGSCSRKGNLNFSYALLFLPHEIADYVVVHELCHLKEMNHKPAFWELVGRAQPEYRQRRRELRRYVQVR